MPYIIDKVAVAPMNPKPAISPEQVELSLRALRHSYQSLIEDFDRCREYAKLQLSQVELLLSVSSKNSSPPSSHSVPIPIRAKKREKRSSLKMIQPYDRMTMHEAIAQVLQHQGGEVETDTIVRELYGKNLTTAEFKVAKDRVTKSLSKGKQLGKWYRSAERSGVYTASLEY